MWICCGMTSGRTTPQIQIVDFDFYDVDAFNRCENENYVLMAVENWRYVHPLLKILPVGLELHHPLRLAALAPRLRQGSAHFCARWKRP